MAQTPTIHAPKNSYSSRSAVTACGKKAGETTTDPALITCGSPACDTPRVNHERKLADAAATAQAFHRHLSAIDTEANEQRLAEAASLAEGLGRPGMFDVRSEGLGVCVTVTTADEAARLYRMADNLGKAAARVRAIIEARAYMAKYEAQKAGAL